MIETEYHFIDYIYSSWSSLAAAGSPQSTPTSSKPKPTPTMDSFQQFKKKADRQKLLEQQEMKQRSHKEAVEKRQQEQQKKREEIDR